MSAGSRLRPLGADSRLNQSKSPIQHLGDSVRTAGPALVSLSDGTLVALTAKGRTIDSDLVVRRVPQEMLRSRIFGAQEAQAAAHADTFLSACPVPARRRARVRAAIIRDCLAHVSESKQCWQLQGSPGERVWGQVRSAGLTPRVAALTVAHAAEYGFWIAAWAMVAQGGLRSSLDHGWRPAGRCCCLR